MVLSNIEDFIETKEKYQAKMWNDQVGFFFLTSLFLAVQILSSWKIALVCAGLEIVLLLLCAKMQSEENGSVFCSFVHGMIWGCLFVVDGWIFLSLMKKEEKDWMIGVAGTILVILCYLMRFFLVDKRIKSGWYAKKKKASFGSELAFSIAIFAISTLRFVCTNSKMDNVGHNEVCIGISALFFILAIFTSLWVDAGVMLYLIKKEIKNR